MMSNGAITEVKLTSPPYSRTGRDDQLKDVVIEEEPADRPQHQGDQRNEETVPGLDQVCLQGHAALGILLPPLCGGSFLFAHEILGVVLTTVGINDLALDGFIAGCGSLLVVLHLAHLGLEDAQGLAHGARQTREAWGHRTATVPKLR